MSSSRWRDKSPVAHLNNGVLHLVLKRKELSSHEKIGKKFKCVLLSERSKSEKTAD